jgi:hypothetical protein
MDAKKGKTRKESTPIKVWVTPEEKAGIAAQREIVTELENATDARRQRIILSRSSVNWVKWTCLFAQAGFTLIAIAIVHSDNRAGAAIAMRIFATGVAVQRRDFCQTRCASASQAGVT